jgi:hypothetical protein
MKIIVVSDTHFSTQKIIERLEIIEDIDMIIHLGDIMSDSKKIGEALGVKTLSVKGNCDFGLEEEPFEKIVEVENIKIIFTHGHRYKVKQSVDRYFYRAMEAEANIALYGHTHVPVNRWIEDVLMFNPGSASLPKEGQKPSFGILNIVDNKVESNIITY